MKYDLLRITTDACPPYGLICIANVNVRAHFGTVQLYLRRNTVSEKRILYFKIIPPSMIVSAPCMKVQSFETKNAMSLASSSGSATLPTHVNLPKSSFASSMLETLAWMKELWKKSQSPVDGRNARHHFGCNRPWTHDVDSYSTIARSLIKALMCKHSLFALFLGNDFGHHVGGRFAHVVVQAVLID